MLKGEVDVTLRGHQLKAVADAELIFDRHGRQRAVTLSGEFADKLLALGDGVAVLVVLIIVMGMAAQEAFGVPAVGQPLQGLQQAGIERFCRGGIVDRLAVNLGGARAVVEGFGAAFESSASERPSGFRRSTWAIARRSFRVHDVGAVFVLKGGHVFARTFGFLNHKDFIGRRGRCRG
ncbi:Uncharacterised protein [Serratia liquefaciens]|nr:Uncharacterised protein [Serratia liquefaciens]